jgi:hypothetical protein
MNVKLLMIAVAAFGLQSARADLIYVEGGSSANLAAYGDSAIVFQVNTDVTVTELKFFGLSMGGGDTPWVQLWNDDTDTSLGIVNWAAGEAGAGWNTKALATAVDLNPGVTYQLQTVAYWVPQYTDDSGFTYGSAIDASSVTFKHDSGWGGWGVLGAPTSANSSAAPAAANLNYTIVPEPTTAMLSLLGLAGLMVRRLKFTR